jgi:predicted RNA-binding protein YlxR (DUF448 family)
MQPSSDHALDLGETRRKRHAGTRSCVGCGARVERSRLRDEMFRLVAVPQDDGSHDILVDLAGSSVGRGIWVHGRRPCLQAAVKKGLARSLKGARSKGRIATDLATLSQRIVDASRRRVDGLLGAALRANRAAVGGTAVSEADEAGGIALLLVAQDAKAAVGSHAVRRAFNEGKAVAWGTKDSLGLLARRSEVAVIAVLDGGIAAALRWAIGLSETFGSAVQGEVDRCNE